MGARREITQAAADKQMRDLGVMVNAGGRVPIDESPDCYKPAEEVIRAVTDAGLAEVEVAPLADRVDQGQRLSRFRRNSLTALLTFASVHNRTSCR